MEAVRTLLLALAMAMAVECGLQAKPHVTYSSKLVHRFSGEMRGLRVSAADGWPEEGTPEYYRRLLRSDLERRKMKIGAQRQLLFPSAGGDTVAGGNDLGWLHYTWIDIGRPSVSFLVALDTGSDLLWLPCDCVQCAPLSDKDLNEYDPSRSNTSKSISCSHQLCDLGPTCKNSKQPCPYKVNYATLDTYSSGSLVEDILHLSSNGVNASNVYVRAPVIIGCGREQSGGYLEGIAPDGLLGLGLGDVSVPSFLAKAGITRNTFSLCFGEEGSGRISFGDQGLATQKTTPFLSIDGKYPTYVVGVENLCVGSTCPSKKSFRALFDTGTSFTSLPEDVYRGVVEEFDRQVNATKYDLKGESFHHCYKSSSQDLLKIPPVMIKFAANNSFPVHNPVFVLNDGQEVIGYCLAITSSSEEMGIIGQNFMKGYRLVFDRENMTLRWSRSKCQDPKGGKTAAGAPTPLPTPEQQRSPDAHGVAPAVAGRAPSKSSAASVPSKWSCLVPLLFVFFIGPNVNILGFRLK